MRTHVIGAGVTGLAFAKAHGDAIVMEASSVIGGKAGSYAVNSSNGSFIFDTGGHWFHLESSPEIMHLLHGLPLIRHERQAHVLLNGRLYDFPIQASFDESPDPAFVKAVAQELQQSTAAGSKPSNYEEFLMASYGNTLYQSFFRDYNRKMYGEMDLSRIEIGYFDTVRNVRLNRSSGYNREFYYPAFDAGAAGIPRHLSKGLPVAMNTPVTAIDAGGKTLIANGKFVHWDKLVSTMPLPQLVQRIVDVDPGILALSRELRSSQGFILNLGIKENGMTPYQNTDWVYVPDITKRFYRVGFYSHVQRQLAPEGCASMYVECSPLHFTCEKEALELIPTIVDELIELGFIRCRSDILVMMPIYLEHNYCLPNVNATSKICDYLRQHDIYSIGRYGSWHWSSQHEDMRQALDLAGQLSPSVTTA
ncbi:FAD-dependent oxidoreductase [Paenibacillus sp. J5C_2022]|uniref:protoporphyrinogen/coproporphyrinogen oxidase n=1 Tax=Paenibacillus sp. J5C2022 TaxID=2977129 RepID=UPI0021CEA8CE|nr:FAD-dependent oxidoreductase [Paenibacillus sp. J5C2022]MCU6709583.1 FAD-dependent oxidoreductase [Paenibacillus sp. J5C2022]